jgi:putative spermidine/putrescine transport system permease protein
MFRTILAIAVSLLCALPLLYLFVLSGAADWRFPDLIPPAWQWSRWLTILNPKDGMTHSLGLSLWLSLCVALTTTPVAFLASKAVAYGKYRDLWLFLAYLPFAASPVIVGTTLMYFYLKLQLDGTLLGVMLAQSMFALGFGMVFFLPFWTREKQAYEALVLTLGGSRWQAYRHALLPLSKGMLWICFFQTFLISWFQYGITLLIGAGRVQTLPLRVFEFVNEANPYYAAVAACLLIVPPSVMILINKAVLFDLQAPEQRVKT